ncbi:MAG: carboxypeptidase-like regulatory domain-containing protein [Muribaculaceae bacterium]|nr:carboxypeptidase-like regulatory domain-containing protein [Muribaculaceae bacterium]
MRKITKTITLSAMAVTAVVVGAVSFKALSYDTEKDALRIVTPPVSDQCPVVRKSKHKTIARDDFFYEDFESMGMAGEFESGWIAIATPGLPDDCWGVGTLGTSDNVVSGTSGACYAYILGNRSTTNTTAHNAWLFSPAIPLKADQEYQIQFNAYLAPGPKTTEQLTVVLCSAPDAESVIVKLDDINDNDAEWAKHAYSFTPSEEGTYHIAFHSTTPHGGNATMIDDLCVSPGAIASFFGKSDIYLGETDPLKGPASGYYEITNKGGLPLTIDVEEVPEGMEIQGLPLTISPGRTRDFSISYLPSGYGLRCGALKLSTSDPAHPQVDINVWVTVNESMVTGYSYEDFEGGKPKGWQWPDAVISTDFYQGHNSSRSYYTRSIYTLNEEGPVGFTTNYIEMGDNPEFSFWYKLMDCDLYGQIQGPTGSENPVMQVLVSEDGGNTYNPVWELGQESGLKHKPSSDWQQITIPLTEYANKTCRVKYEIWNDANPLEHDFIILIDDVCTGTQPSKDLRVSELYPSSEFKAGVECSVGFKLKNLGKEAASGYKITLKDGESTLASVTGPDLDSNKEVETNISWTPDKPGFVSLSVTAEIDGDANLADNTTISRGCAVLSKDSEKVEIGAGQEGQIGVAPVYLGSRETATQSIYLANEIGSDCGEISSIEFISFFNNGIQTDPIEVFIAETDRKDFSDNGWVPDSEFTKVFEGSFFVPQGRQTLTIPFTTPFPYHGSNLVVMLRKMTDEFIVGKNFVAHSTTEPRTIYSGEMQRGILVENGYENRFAVNGLAHAIFNFVFPETGTIEGRVSDANGAVGNVSVSLDGTNLEVTTNRKGDYQFPKIGLGKKSVTAVKYGYAPTVCNNIEIKPSVTTTADITLTPYAKGDLSGTVTDGESRPVAGSVVTLRGYADYSVWTDKDGHYTISDVYMGTPISYDLKVQSSYYADWNRHGLKINDSSTIDVAVTEKVLPPHKPAADMKDKSVQISWELPLAEFAHDNGTPVESLGFNHGHNHTMLMTTFLEPLDIREIRWYIHKASGRHANFNVYIMELDKNGFPDPTNMLYTATNVDFVDDAWNSHILPNAVRTNGCAVGINCNGFAGLGATPSDEDHPFESGRHFFAGDEYLMEDGIQDFDIFTDMLPMIRVCGERLDLPKGLEATRPNIEYEVYRLSGDDFGKKEYIGKTSELNLSDLSPIAQGGSDYCYIVKAIYLSAESEGVYTNTVKNSSGVDEVEDLNGLKIIMKDGSIIITGEEEIETLLIHDLSGQLLLSMTHPSDRIDGLNYGNKPVVATAILNNGSRISFLLMSK